MLTGMSPKQRFQILLEPEQIAALRRIQERTAAPLASQIRQAVQKWIEQQGEGGKVKSKAKR